MKDGVFVTVHWHDGAVHCTRQVENWEEFVTNLRREGKKPMCVRRSDGKLLTKFAPCEGCCAWTQKEMDKIDKALAKGVISERDAEHLRAYAR